MSAPHQDARRANKASSDAILRAMASLLDTWLQSARVRTSHEIEIAASPSQALATLPGAPIAPDLLFRGGPREPLAGLAPWSRTTEDGRGRCDGYRTRIF